MSGFDYNQAFSRNLGLVTPDEQRRLRQARVGIIGAGGVGGVHAITLARMGVGKLRLIDPDRFDLVNFNRQMAANMSTLNQPKAEATAQMVRQINPDAEVEALDAALDSSTMDSFLSGLDLVVDGVDFFAFDTRILSYRACRERGLTVVSSGPLGMSATMHVFAPDRGMTFEQYYDVHPEMSRLDKTVAFLAALTPRMSQRPYMDYRYSNIDAGYGPSLAPACMLCAGVVGVESLRVLLGRPGLRPAPHWYQFDAYRHRLFKGVLRFGNRGPVQRLKRWLIKRVIAAQTGSKTAPAEAGV